MNKYRIPAVAVNFAATAKVAVALARSIGQPVAMKIVSPDIAHKTDVGGVKLNLTGAGEIRRAFEEITAGIRQKVPKARIEGVTVSPMADPGGVEIILGIMRDPQYGHALMFGLGGIFTEIYRDVQFCLLPASDKEFLKAIHSIKGYPLLSGARGQKPRDEKALLAMMKALARLIKENPHIDQIDLNPVLLYEKGVVAVDFRIYGST